MVRYGGGAAAFPSADLFVRLQTHHSLIELLKGFLTQVDTHCKPAVEKGGHVCVLGSTLHSIWSSQIGVF